MSVAEVTSVMEVRVRRCFIAFLIKVLGIDRIQPLHHQRTHERASSSTVVNPVRCYAIHRSGTISPAAQLFVSTLAFRHREVAFMSDWNGRAMAVNGSLESGPSSL